MSRYLWLSVTSDEYEFTLEIEPTAQKLADKLGVKVSTVLKNESRKQSGRNTGRKIVKVKA